MQHRRYKGALGLLILIPRSKAGDGLTAAYELDVSLKE